MKAHWVIRTPLISECGYVDHQCFFALYEMMDPAGRLVNPQRLAYESQPLKERVHRAHQDGIKVYHVFGRSLTEFLIYEAFEVYAEDDPRVESARIFLGTVEMGFSNPAHHELGLESPLSIRVPVRTCLK